MSRLRGKGCWFGISGAAVFELMVVWGMGIAAQGGGDRAAGYGIAALPVQMGSAALLVLSLVRENRSRDPFRRSGLLRWGIPMLIQTEIACILMGIAGMTPENAAMEYAGGMAGHALRTLLPCTIMALSVERAMRRHPFLLLPIAAVAGLLLWRSAAELPSYGLGAFAAIQPFAALLPALHGQEPVRRKSAAVERMPEERNRMQSAVLALLFGGMGVHRLYLGYTKEGVLQALGGSAAACLLVALAEGRLDGGAALIYAPYAALALTTGIWSLTDFFQILRGRLKPENGREWVEK